METEKNEELAQILKKLKKLSSRINDMDERMTRMEVELRTLAHLEIYAKHMPDLVLEKIFPVLQQMAKLMEKHSPIPQVYQKHTPTRKDNWSWKEHILYTLFQEDRPLMTVELVEIHFQLGVKGKRDERLVRKDIAKNLTDLVKDGRIVKYKPEGHTKFYYCLPKWMDNKYNLLEEYWGKSAFL